MNSMDTYILDVLMRVKIILGIVSIFGVGALVALQLIIFKEWVAGEGDYDGSRARLKTATKVMTPIVAIVLLVVIFLP